MDVTGEYDRQVEPRFDEMLEDTPVVLIHGPRQCGKTTFAKHWAERVGATYLTFDDDVTLESAQRDPVAFMSGLGARVVLDEIQRVPTLFKSIKAEVGRLREPGRFLLTGSTNILLLPKLADSLAGRMGILRLHPFTQSELAGTEPTFLDHLFDGTFKTRRVDRLGPDLIARIVAGGFPAALARKTASRRAAWYREYVETLVQRDVRELARIASLDAIPRLIDLAAGRTAKLFNSSDLASAFQLSRPTIRDYVTLLERIFLIDLLPPWHSNRSKRLVKTPKLHLVDTGIACAVMGVTTSDLTADRTMAGPLLETFVFQELRRLASFRDDDLRFYHFRDRDDFEVDIVIERGARSLVGIEVKLSATVFAADFRGLTKLAALSGKRFTAGVVLYDGDIMAPFGERLYAVPLRCLWENI